jgi:uncharacterized protein with PIN domain
MDESSLKLFCCDCKKALVEKRVDFTYLGHDFHADALRCPECGRVFIPESLAEGRMKEVEEMLEEK